MNIIEVEDHKIISDYLNEESIIIDCGACVGNFTQKLWDKYHCNFYLFEPDSRNFRQLRYRFSIYKKIRLMRIAISDIGGDRIFYTGRFETASSLLPSHRGLDGNSIVVDCISLNDYIDGFKYIDLIKLDTEGEEIKIIPSLNIENLKKVKQITVEYHLQSEIDGYTQEKIDICREYLKKQFNEIEYIDKGNDGQHGLYLNKEL